VKVGETSLSSFAATLADRGVAIRAGPFVSRVVTPLSELAASLHLLYADFPIEEDGICDFHVSVRPALWRLPWLTEFLLDREPVYRPFHRRAALAMFEWGSNWCICTIANHFLIIHAAVVERAGGALLLPGRPGAGKSTLCAGLVNSGWRLLSDELALLDPASGRLHPIARPVSLKGVSIEIVRDRFPGVVFGPPTSDTQKGTVAHMRPPPESVSRADQPAVPRWVVTPRFAPGREVRVEPISKASALFRVADNSVNYGVLGEAGFRAVVRLVDRCDCHELTHDALEEAVAALDDLCRNAVPEEHHAAGRT
jgi:HprK-related kinase A